MIQVTDLLLQYIIMTLSNDIIKATNQNDKTFIVDKDGKLGINTKPLADLDVNGNANISDSLEVNKDLFVNRNQIVEGEQIINGNSFISGDQLVKGKLEIEKDLINKKLTSR